MAPRLAAVLGPLRGWVIYLDDPVISIGRQLSNNIVVADSRISHHHCQIRREGERFVIEDLDSANGTYVNYRRIKETLLREGSIIDLGNSRFIFWTQELDELIASRRNEIVDGNSCQFLRT
jgi:pSer/pThr/pTyr-binding forkhead associated (FHA) protein